jgi:glycosyltransferase involved in cell wall biosynthesis
MLGMPRICCVVERAEAMEACRPPLQVTLVGHPFSSIGTGRALRVAFAAYRSVGIDVAVRDVWGSHTSEAAQVAPIEPFVTTRYGAVNVFHLNGDEVVGALNHLGPLPPGRNIVVPFWELPRYPAEWARQLERFDEVWAASDYIRQSITAVADMPVMHMPLATEIALDSFAGRRQFGIPEDSYAFLFFFDCRSYIMRKNPHAVVDCFRRLLAARPWTRTCLVIKLQGIEVAPTEVEDFLADLSNLRPRVVVLQGVMPEARVHNLIRCCDSFVSLHRSEGFGLGLAEAMYLGLPVIGTGYSGNMDFMTTENSMLVGHRLVPVPPEGYPHAENQHWAEPDLNAATEYMIGLVDDPAAGRALGARGSRSIRTDFSYRAIGLRYAQRLAEIGKADSTLAAA